MPLRARPLFLTSLTELVPASPYFITSSSCITSQEAEERQHLLPPHAAYIIALVTVAIRPRTNSDKLPAELNQPFRGVSIHTRLSSVPGSRRSRFARALALVRDHV